MTSYLLLIANSATLAQTVPLPIISMENGLLAYGSDEEGNQIPDFSYAGYKNSNVGIPVVTKVLKTISPVMGDNTNHINQAILSMARKPKDSYGIRGVLLLEKGRYDVFGVIRVNVDGIIIRGAGSGHNPDSATVIYGRGNSPEKRTIMVAGSGTAKWEKQGEQTNITTEFVPVNGNSFEVESTKGYHVGDVIVIEHPCTEEWLHAIDYGGTAGAASERWKVDEYPIVFKRTIKEIRGNTIVTDVPLYNHLNKKLAQSYIYKIREDIRNNIGIEDLRIEISDWKNRDSDEDHARNALQLKGVEDCWVKNVSTAYFINSGVSLVNANRVTVADCLAEDPVSRIHGGRRYNFSVDDYCSQILFKDCIAKKGRHNYISNGATTVSGIVFLHCVSIDPYASSEGHRKWSMAVLFDNFQDRGHLIGNHIVLGAYNRGSYGTGHGWSLAHSVIWNCDLKRPDGRRGIVICQKPPTAQNYVIGGFGDVNRNVPFPQYPAGHITGINKGIKLLPESLFQQQLKERTGR
ncbi:hypothetical protein B0I27_10354 [Arcticibacter pallidicorallinus]|uniref:Pectate lyase-like protein n=2 Tax=Arcticibacter pallidicorallinus TaxID=1259464 RepID=A0A2T0U6Q1_9SPHI|nr:hypothetical protein B0I27_10354 [Arcticibacter pallidicorallinus]